PAGDRRRDRRGDNVGRQHPRNSVLGCTKACLHMRQRDVCDGGVKHLHHHRRHYAERDQAAMLDLVRRRRDLRGHCAAGFSAAPDPGPLWVSTSTEALRPIRNSTLSVGSVKWMRTGTRCTTFTQLPVAFWAGSTENIAPVPAPMLATSPL